MIILLFCFPLISSSQIITLDSNSFEYKLDTSWNIAERDSTEGIKRLLYKRNPIRDSNNIDVIPNIQILVFKIINDKNVKEKDDSDPFDIMTLVVLLNYAPPVVLKEYQLSKLKPPIKYQSNYKPFYGFVSEYTDNFNEPHDCYYFTLMNKDQIGVLILVDSTKEIFPYINKEILQFVSSFNII